MYRPRRRPGGTLGGWSRGAWAILSFRQRVQLERADEQLEPLRLQEDLARRGGDTVGLVHRLAVDPDLDPVAVADAFDPVPFASRVLHVVLASGVEEFLEVRVVLRPPELSAGESLRRAALRPSRPLVGPEDHVAREPHRDGRPSRLSPRDDDQVADAPLRELALDRGHPGAARAAVGSGRMQQDAGVAHRLAAVGPFAPTVLHDQAVV